MQKIKVTKRSENPTHPNLQGLGLTPDFQATVRGWSHSAQMDGVLYLGLEEDGRPFAQVVPRGTQAHLVEPRPRRWIYFQPYAWKKPEARSQAVEDLQRVIDLISWEAA